MEAVNVFTINELVTLYKDETPANKIELARFEEVGYEVVVGMDNHRVGDEVVFIMPDYCVSDISIFHDFIFPGGDPKKSYLGLVDGKPRRIRAKKFNLHIGDGKPVYSNGIILKTEVVEEYLNIDISKLWSKYDSKKMSEYLTEALGVAKYKVPEPVNKIGNARRGEFPSGMYKTDEENINNLWNDIKYPIRLVGTEKVDGSSISIGVSKKYPKGFITSRNVNKALTKKVYTGERKKTFLEKLCFWKTPDLSTYEEKISDDKFVQVGMPYLKNILKHKLTNIILRGEVYGGSFKGSGNKNNPSQGKNADIKFFNVDKVINGITVKESDLRFMLVCRGLDLQPVKTLFDKQFNSKEEIVKECENKFEEYKEKHGKLIEGIVLATPDNMFSCKYMNNEYDSKK